MDNIAIRITGLSAADVKICELLWNSKDVNDVETLIRSLPPAHQPRARTLQSMIMAEVIDQVINDDPDLIQAREVLARF